MKEITTTKNNNDLFNATKIKYLPNIFKYVLQQSLKCKGKSKINFYSTL